MRRRQLGQTDLEVAQLCLGGDVFGWTADARTSFEILDTYVEAGGNFLDTADIYSAWVEGNSGGESEAIIGRWMAARGNRDSLIVATKAGRAAGLGAQALTAAVEGSLRRLGCDHIDLLYSHVDDPDTPLEETLAAFRSLIDAGKVRWIGASNHTAARLEEALAVAEREGLTRYSVLQNKLNLVERFDFEGEVAELCRREGLAVVTHSALAQGYLTGKYRPDKPLPEGRAAELVEQFEEHGLPVLDELDAISERHGVSLAAVAFAWASNYPGVSASIASARRPDQLRDTLAAVDLELDQAEHDRLTSASA